MSGKADERSAGRHTNPFFTAEQVARYHKNKTDFDVLDKAGDIVCPFCGEGDFDRIGLKHHFFDCNDYEVTR